MNEYSFTNSIGSNTAATYANSLYTQAVSTEQPQESIEENNDEETGKMLGIETNLLPIMGDTVRITKSSLEIGKKSIENSEGIVTYSSLLGGLFIAEVIIYKLGDLPVLGKYWLASDDLIRRLEKSKCSKISNILVNARNMETIDASASNEYMSNEYRNNRFLVFLNKSTTSVLKFSRTSTVYGKVNVYGNTRIMAKLLALTRACNILLRSTSIFYPEASPDTLDLFARDSWNVFKLMLLERKLHEVKAKGINMGNSIFARVESVYNHMPHGYLSSPAEDKDILRWAQENGIVSTKRSTLIDIQHLVIYLNMFSKMLLRNYQVLKSGMGVAKAKTMHSALSHSGFYAWDSSDTHDTERSGLMRLTSDSNVDIEDYSAECIDTNEECSDEELR